MVSIDDILLTSAVSFLKQLIAIPSYSREEAGTANAIAQYLDYHLVPYKREGNNIIAFNKYYDAARPSILLNSHHDTVRPNKGYTLDPFTPLEKEGKLYGLGSNDAGGALTALIHTFLHFYEQHDLKYNLILATTAEEEISGAGGIELALTSIPPISFAIVGEPTGMQMAVAEKGLLVLDCTATGRAGHAAREEGSNSIYKALEDIAWFKNYRFEKISSFLGPVKMSVTVVETENKAHNIIPDNCRFVVDIRVNELYDFETILEVIRAHVTSVVKPRSTRLRSTSIPMEHPIVQAGLRLGLTCYGSPTTSDKALMPFPALKIGPGESARSHTADEYIYLEEIINGVKVYVALINEVVK